MASPAFDSNAWYSIQNFGNDYYLGCSDAGSCSVDTTGLNSSELFQITTANSGSPFYIRPRSVDTDSSGQPYCVNINGGTPAIALCSNSSATWGTGYWNGANTGDGLFFFSTQQGDSRRLYLSNDDDTFSFLDYNSASQTDLDLMRWGVSSRSAINDESYSTVPAAIASSTSTTSVTTTTSTASTTTASTSTDTSSTETTSSTTSESTSESSSIPSADPSTSTQFLTTSQPGSTESPSTMTVVVTPTATASTSTSSSSSQTPSSTAPTLVNSGGKVASNSMAAIAMMLLVPSIVSWFS